MPFLDGTIEMPCGIRGRIFISRNTKQGRFDVFLDYMKEGFVTNGFV